MVSEFLLNFLNYIPSSVKVPLYTGSTKTNRSMESLKILTSHTHNKNDFIGPCIGKDLI